MPTICTGPATCARSSGWTIAARTRGAAASGVTDGVGATVGVNSGVGDGVPSGVSVGVGLTSSVGVGEGVSVAASNTTYATLEIATGYSRLSG